MEIKSEKVEVYLIGFYLIELNLGAYGVVYKALNVETGKFVAVKHIKITNVDLESSLHLENLSIDELVRAL